VPGDREHPVALQAVITAQARQIPQREPVDRADGSDVLDALSLIRYPLGTRGHRPGRAALLLAARTEAADGKPLLTVRRIAAALTSSPNKPPKGDTYAESADRTPPPPDSTNPPDARGLSRSV
jgi:hypothetical protein